MTSAQSWASKRETNWVNITNPMSEPKSESSSSDWGPGGGSFSSNRPWRQLIEFPLPLCVSLSAVWTAGVYPAQHFILLHCFFHTQCAFCSLLHTCTHTHTEKRDRGTYVLCYGSRFSIKNIVNVQHRIQAFILPTKMYITQNVICNDFKQKHLSHDIQL